MALFLHIIIIFFSVILIHELGHWAVGYILGAKPEVFSIGFGKKIFSFNALGTEFRICIIPLGGYVSFKNYQFDHEKTREDQQRLSSIKWVFISLAGPMANFLLTYLIFFSIIFTTLFSFDFYSYDNKIIMSKIKPTLFDTIVPVDFFEKNYIQYDGESISKLEKKSLNELTPLKATLFQKSSEAMYWSSKGLLLMTIKTVDAFKTLLIPSRFNKEASVMGPIGIVKEIKKSSEKSFIDILMLISSLSFAIGFFNLLPLSILDGGRAIMGIYESITKSNLNSKLVLFLHRMSSSIIFSLLIFATIFDLNVF